MGVQGFTIALNPFFVLKLFKGEICKMWKAAGGGFVGVIIPIGVEYGAKGARVTPGTVKWSGLVGVGEGVVGLGAAYGSSKGVFLRGLSDADRAALAAFGGAGLATGVSIIVLDELRKRALYEFKKKYGGRVPSRLPLTEEGFPRMEEETPTHELVEEI